MNRANELSTNSSDDLIFLRDQGISFDLYVKAINNCLKLAVHRLNSALSRYQKKYMQCPPEDGPVSLVYSLAG